MATDFFDRQDAARRQTGRLVVLFAAAVAGIVAAVYAVATVAVVVMSRNAQGAPPPALWAWDRFATVATIVLLAITAGSLFKILVLREGGEAVARMLGGRPVDPSTRDPAERRLLNVVEEMALASGMPVPPVYLLDQEPGINAFAAGFTPGDAALGVSRGCLDHLTRDELQGVIGHEFSHVLNGDMRLNLRMIALLHGILLLALVGQLLVRAAPNVKGKDSAGIATGLFFSGAALFVIGSLGALFGRLIKCAVSRQREYLADASSVQFTRNPSGIAGALKKIGGLAAGSRVRSPNAEQACHMFFGQGVPSFARLLATHPPLEERIRRLDPTFDGVFPPVAEGRTVEVGDDEQFAGASAFAASGGTGGSPTGGGWRPDTGGRATSATRPLSPEEAVASVGTPTQQHVDYAAALIERLSPTLAGAAREPFSARAVVYALLLDHDEAVRSAQLGHLERNAEPGTVHEVLRLRPEAEALGPEARLPLVDLTFPALRRLSATQYRAFRANVDALVHADRRVSLFEYALHRMLLRHLDREFFRLRPPAVRYESLDPLFGDSTVLLSSLARLGHEDGAGVARAFETGLDRLQGRYPGERKAGLLPLERCTLAGVDRALDRLALAAPGVKRRVLEACAACIACDGVVTLGEGELLRAIADSLDCPMPPLLAPVGRDSPQRAHEGAERKTEGRTIGSGQWSVGSGQ
jgi:Zn-dependent protease with chaperone function